MLIPDFIPTPTRQDRALVTWWGNVPMLLIFVLTVSMAYVWLDLASALIAASIFSAIWAWAWVGAMHRVSSHWVAERTQVVSNHNVEP